MEKEKVLEFEILSDNEVGIVVELRQNTELLKRGKNTKFSRSFIYPCWDIIRKELYTYGSDKKYDNLIFTVPKDDINLFLDKVNSINAKYSKPKRWRAEYNKRYYYIDSRLDTNCAINLNDIIDNKLYEIGNHFKTEEEAQLYANKLKKILSERE